MAKTSAPKPSSGLPKASTATIAFDPYVTTQEPVFGSNPGARGEGSSITLYKRLNHNEPFDDRLYPALPWTGKIFRGYIANHQPPGPNRLRFMYNPNQMDMDYQLGGSLIDPSQTGGIQTAGALGGHAVGFKMFFDRHYEVAYNNDSRGVWKDIEVLESLVGMEENQGWMVQQALKFVFSTGPRGVFYGYIHSLYVKLGFFSEEMIPMMAEVDVGTTFVPPTTKPSDYKIYVPGETTGTDTKTTDPATTTSTTAASSQGTLTSQGH